VECNSRNAYRGPWSELASRLPRAASGFTTARANLSLHIRFLLTLKAGQKPCGVAFIGENSCVTSMDTPWKAQRPLLPVFSCSARAARPGPEQAMATRPTQHAMCNPPQPIASAQDAEQTKQPSGIPERASVVFESRRPRKTNDWEFHSPRLRTLRCIWLRPDQPSNDGPVDVQLLGLSAQLQYQAYMRT